MANRKVLFRSGAVVNEVSPSADAILISSIDQQANTFTHKASGVTLYSIAASGLLTMAGGFSIVPTTDDTGTIGVDPSESGGDPLGVGSQKRFHLIRGRRIKAGATITLEDSIDISNSADGVGAASTARVKYESATQALRVSENATAFDDVVLRTKAQTLTNKTITAPSIGDFTNSQHSHQNAAGGGQLDHGLALTGLADDDHAQYALLAGRAGGQLLRGGTAASENLTLQSTANATRGNIVASDSFLTTSTATRAAIRIGSVAGDPSALANGDIWYDSTGNKFRARENGVSTDLISAGSGSSGWTDDGTIVRLTTVTDNVTIGVAALLGTEKVRMTGGDILIDRTSATALMMRTTAGAFDILAIDTSTPVVLLKNHSAAISAIAGDRLHISMDGSNLLTIDTYDTPSVPTLITRKARGTAALPTAVLSGDQLGSFSARGFGTTGFSSGSRGRFIYTASENWTDAAHGTRWEMQVTPNGGILTATSLRVDQTGRTESNLSFDVDAAFGDANPLARLSGTSLSFGAGGGSALDVMFTRVAAGVTDYTDGVAGATAAQLRLRSATTVDYSAVLRLTGESLADFQGGYVQYDGAANEIIIGTHDALDTLTASDIEKIRIGRTAGGITRILTDGSFRVTDQAVLDHLFLDLTAHTFDLFDNGGANPRFRVSFLGVTELLAGTGGASVLDTRFARTAAATWTVNNNAGGGALVLSAVTGALFYESSDGAAATVSGAATGRLIYNNTTGRWRVSTQTSAYADIALASGNASNVAFVQGGNSFGVAGDLGTNDAFALNLRTTGVTRWQVPTGSFDLIQQGAGALRSSADNALTIGNATQRLVSISAILHDVFAASADANPSARLSTTALLLGVGGATALDTRIRRTAANTLTVDGNASNSITIVPNADSNGVFGTTTLRFSDMVANLHRVFAAATDANPSAQLSTGAVILGVGGATALDTRMRRTAAATLTLDNNSTGAVTIVPATDSQNVLGTATLRWSIVAANTHNVFGASGDANPTVQITTQSITMGPGAGTAVDTRLRRTGVATFTIDNGSTGGATVVPATTNTGVLGTDALKWSRVRATSVVTGDLEMIDEMKGVHYKFVEEMDAIYVKDMKKKKMYRIPMVEVPWRE